MKLDKTLVHTVFPAVAVIAMAVLCRAVAFSTENDFLDRLANFTRIYLYLGLLAVWGISVYRRVLQLQVRRYLVVVVILMAFWLTVREFRWHLVANADIKRWLWYPYYIGILPIPLLALFDSDDYLSVYESADMQNILSTIAFQAS